MDNQQESINPLDSNSNESGAAEFVTAADVRFRAVLDEGIVIRQRAAEVLVLNEVGVRILELIGERKTYPQIVDTLFGEFEVERPQLASDVTAFLRQLDQAGVIEQRRGPDAPKDSKR